MRKKIKAKPCPFCGSNRTCHRYEYLGKYSLVCKGCWASTGPCSGRTDEDAIKAAYRAWNKRVKEKT